MGCGGSVEKTVADGGGGTATVPKGGPLMHKASGRSVHSAKRGQDEVSVAESCPRSQWEAGFLMDEDVAGPVNTFEDYRGFPITMSTNASRNKADVVCRWADAAIEEREKNGGVFFNPQDPTVWPKDLLATYNAYFSDQFADASNANASKKGRNDGGQRASKGLSSTNASSGAVAQARQQQQPQQHHAAKRTSVNQAKERMRGEYDRVAAM